MFKLETDIRRDPDSLFEKAPYTNEGLATYAEFYSLYHNLINRTQAPILTASGLLLTAMQLRGEKFYGANVSSDLRTNRYFLMALSGGTHRHTTALLRFNEFGAAIDLQSLGIYFKPVKKGTVLISAIYTRQENFQEGFYTTGAVQIFFNKVTGLVEDIENEDGSPKEPSMFTIDEQIEMGDPYAQILINGRKKEDVEQLQSFVNPFDSSSVSLIAQSIIPWNVSGLRRLDIAGNYDARRIYHEVLALPNECVGETPENLQNNRPVRRLAEIGEKLSELLTLQNQLPF